MVSLPWWNIWHCVIQIVLLKKLGNHGFMWLFLGDCGSPGACRRQCRRCAPIQNQRRDHGAGSGEVPGQELEWTLPHLRHTSRVLPRVLFLRHGGSNDSRLVSTRQATWLPVGAVCLQSLLANQQNFSGSPVSLWGHSCQTPGRFQGYCFILFQEEEHL